MARRIFTLNASAAIPREVNFALAQALAQTYVFGKQFDVLEAIPTQRIRDVRRRDLLTLSVSREIRRIYDGTITAAITAVDHRDVEFVAKFLHETGELRKFIALTPVIILY